MRLDAAASGGSFDLITSLIQVPIATSDGRDLIVVPTIEYVETIGYSTLLHEVTHQWCMRNTRLGWRAATAAARALMSNAPVADRDVSLFGAMAPWLEGLALYAELDYVADDGDPVYSPVAKVLDVFSLAIGKSGRELALVIRDDAVGHGLLEHLFLADNDASTQHYFAGYLHIKQLSELIQRRSEVATTPGYLLPLLIKLVCDQPALISDDGPMAGGALEDTVKGIDWHRADQLLADPSLAGWFDVWDLWAHIGSGIWDVPRPFAAEEAMSVLDRLTEPEADQMLSLRSHTAIHLLRSERGVLRRRLGDAGGPYGELETNAGSLPLHLVSFRRYWDGARFSPEAVSLAMGAEEWFGGWLGSREGETITLATFMTLSDFSFGIAGWEEDGSLGAWTVATPEVFADGEIPSWLMAGLKMSPAERFRVADWPREWKQFGRARRNASGELTRLVVSDGAVGESAQRFLAPTLRRSYAALEQHLHRGLPPFSTRPPDLPADAVAVLDEYFRIPDGHLLLPRPEVTR